MSSAMRLTLSVDINILQEELHITDKAAFDVHVKTMQDKSRAMHLTDEQKQRMQSKKDARKKAEEEVFAQLALEQKQKAAAADEEYERFLQKREEEDAQRKEKAQATAKAAQNAAAAAQAQLSEKERTLQKTLEDAMADGVIDEEEQRAIDLAKAEAARAKEEAAKSAAAAQARKAEEEALDAQARTSEKERALQKTLEDAMADGVIDEEEQRAIDLAKAEAARAKEEAAKTAAAAQARKAEEEAFGADVSEKQSNGLNRKDKEKNGLTKKMGQADVREAGRKEGKMISKGVRDESKIKPGDKKRGKSNGEKTNDPGSKRSLYSSTSTHSWQNEANGESRSSRRNRQDRTDATEQESHQQRDKRTANRSGKEEGGLSLPRKPDISSRRGWKSSTDVIGYDTQAMHPRRIEAAPFDRHGDATDGAAHYYSRYTDAHTPQVDFRRGHQEFSPPTPQAGALFMLSSHQLILIIASAGVGSCW